LAGLLPKLFTEEVSSGEGWAEGSFIDLDEAHTLTYSEPLSLQDGYELAVKDLRNNEEINFVLLKKEILWRKN
jgi:hypothetical protein